VPVDGEGEAKLREALVRRFLIRFRGQGGVSDNAEASDPLPPRTYGQVTLNDGLVARPLFDEEPEVKDKQPASEERERLNDEVGQEGRSCPEAVQAVELVVDVRTGSARSGRTGYAG